MTRPRRRNQGRPGIGSARWDCKASADEAALIGRDDGLNAVPGAELGQHVAHVSLDGLHAEEQLGCDLRVGPALCDEPQDLGFAVGEVRLGEPATRRPAAASRPRLSRPSDRPSVAVPSAEYYRRQHPRRRPARRPRVQDRLRGRPHPPGRCPADRRPHQAAPRPAHAPETPGPVHRETRDRVAGQNMRLAHDAGQRPQQPARQRHHPPSLTGRRLRDKLTGLTATVRMNTERVWSTFGSGRR